MSIVCCEVLVVRVVFVALQADESDEEDQCALSDKWRFQRSSRRWSRKDLDLDLPTSTTGDDSLEKSGIRSSSSHDSVLTDNEESVSQRDESSPVLHSRHRIASVGAAPPQPSPSEEHRHFLPMSAITAVQQAPQPHKGQNGEALQHHNNNQPGCQPQAAAVAAQERGAQESPLSPGSIRRAASERIKGAKNNFLKRMESLKQKKTAPKKARLPASPPGERLQISAPVVATSDSESFRERLDNLGCVDVSPSNDSSPSFNMDRLHPAKVGADSLELDSSLDGADISPSLYKRGGRVFLDASNSSLEESKQKRTAASSSAGKSSSSSLSTPATAATSTAPLSAPTELPACFSKFGVLPAAPESPRSLRRSSDLDTNFTPGSFPKLVAHGYIETTSGSQINYRTGSFNLGSESSSYRDSFQKRSSGSKPTIARASSEEPGSRSSSGAASLSRLSIYDNVPLPAESSDPQHELDLILSDLFKNINDLTLRSQEVEVEIGQLQPQQDTGGAGEITDSF